jgi:hypothetical protein
VKNIEQAVNGCCLATKEKTVVRRESHVVIMMSRVEKDNRVKQDLIVYHINALVQFINPSTG